MVSHEKVDQLSISPIAQIEVCIKQAHISFSQSLKIVAKIQF